MWFPFKRLSGLVLASVLLTSGSVFGANVTVPSFTLATRGRIVDDGSLSFELATRGEMDLVVEGGSQVWRPRGTELQ